MFPVWLGACVFLAKIGLDGVGITEGDVRGWCREIRDHHHLPRSRTLQDRRVDVANCVMHNPIRKEDGARECNDQFSNARCAVLRREHVSNVLLVGQGPPRDRAR